MFENDANQSSIDRQLTRRNRHARHCLVARDSRDEIDRTNDRRNAHRQIVVAFDTESLPHKPSRPVQSSTTEEGGQRRIVKQANRRRFGSRYRRKARRRRDKQCRLAQAAAEQVNQKQNNNTSEAARHLRPNDRRRTHSTCRRTARPRRKHSIDRLSQIHNKMNRHTPRRRGTRSRSVDARLRRDSALARDDIRARVPGHCAENPLHSSSKSHVLREPNQKKKWTLQMTSTIDERAPFAMRQTDTDTHTPVDWPAHGSSAEKRIDVAKRRRARAHFGQVAH